MRSGPVILAAVAAVTLAGVRHGDRSRDAGLRRGPLVEGHGRRAPLARPGALHPRSRLRRAPFHAVGHGDDRLPQRERGAAHVGVAARVGERVRRLPREPCARDDPRGRVARSSPARLHGPRDPPRPAAGAGRDGVGRPADPRDRADAARPLRPLPRRGVFRQRDPDPRGRRRARRPAAALHLRGRELLLADVVVAGAATRAGGPDGRLDRHPVRRRERRRGDARRPAGARLHARRRPLHRRDPPGRPRAAAALLDPGTSAREVDRTLRVAARACGATPPGTGRTTGRRSTSSRGRARSRAAASRWSTPRSC